MQFEAQKPSDRRLAPRRQAPKDAMLSNTPIVADCQRSGIDKGDNRTHAETGVQIDPQRHNRGREELDKARLADEGRKCTVEMLTHVFRIERFEGALVRLMKQYQDGHHLAQCQFACTMALSRTAQNTVLVPRGFKRLTKIIDSTKEFAYPHRGLLFRYTFGFSTHSVAEKRALYPELTLK